MAAVRRGRFTSIGEGVTRVGRNAAAPVNGTIRLETV